MAPFLAGIISTLLSNNLPKVAQAVIDKGLDKVEEKLGIKLEPDMSADKLAELKLAAMKHEEFQVDQTNKNTADARAMQVAALAQADAVSKRFVYFFAAFWSLSAVAYIGCITFLTIPEANIRFADGILGFVLGTVIANILNFFFGSTLGSHKKTDIMALK